MKKRLLGILISFVMLLTIMLGTTSASLAGACPNIRVLLTIGSPTSFGFKLNNVYSVSVGNVSQGNIGADNYTVSVEGANIVLRNSVGVLAMGADITLLPTTADGLININHPSYGSTYYKGDFIFTIVGGKLQLINRLDLETYLYGVLPYEMNNSFSLEALKAQAVCARTFSAIRMAGAGTSAYDLDDTGAHAQVYRGYDAATDKCIQAVEETRNQVLKYGDSYVNCYYSASNGGWTEITQHRWTATEPLKAYDQIKADPYDTANPSSRQERLVLPGTITAENPMQYQNWSGGVYAANSNSPVGVDNASRYLRLCALQAVRNSGYIANVSDDIQILGFNNIVPKTYEYAEGGQHHGGVGSYNGNDVTGKNDCRDMTQADINMSVLASRYARTDETSGYILGDADRNGAISIADYTFVRLHILGRQALPAEAMPIADVDRNGTVSISDYTLIRLHILGLKAIDGRTNDGIVREPIQVIFSINLPDMDVGAAYQSFFVSSLGLFTVEFDGINWFIYQRRYGHGIGLSQRGAQQRAKSVAEGGGGQTYNQILEFYFSNYPGYPAVTLTAMY